MLGGGIVTDIIDEGDRIAHVLENGIPGGAREVTGTIDWQRRFDHMQQHTGQHLLSAVLEEAYGYHTVSVHFGHDYSSLDIDVTLDSTPNHQVNIYVHGFHTSMPPEIELLAKLNHFTFRGGAMVCFSWPSRQSLRLYGSETAFFDQTWKPDDVVKVK